LVKWYAKARKPNLIAWRGYSSVDSPRKYCGAGFAFIFNSHNSFSSNWKENNNGDEEKKEKSVIRLPYPDAKFSGMLPFVIDAWGKDASDSGSDHSVRFERTFTRDDRFPSGNPPPKKKKTGRKRRVERRELTKPRVEGFARLYSVEVFPLADRDSLV